MLNITHYQFGSVAQSCPTLCYPMDCSMPGFLFITNSRSLLKLMSIESVMLSNHLVLCCLLLLRPSISPSIRVFSNESTLCIGLAKVLKLQLQHQSFQSISSVDDTTLMTESEELKSFLMKVKEESEKTWLKTQHSKN